MSAPTDPHMATSDLINGGIQFVIALIFVLVGVGVIPIGKTKAESDEKRHQYRFYIWMGAVVMFIMAIAKIFGVMR